MNCLFSTRIPKLPGARSGDASSPWGDSDAPVALFQTSPGQLATKASLAPFCDGASQLRAERAFTRLDMMVLIGLVALLLAWFGLGRIGERGRIARCAGNLAALGKAMHGYANEHNGALPIAGIDLGKVQSSWDMQVFPYLAPGLAKANDARLAEIIPRFFFCPSDTANHNGTPRSYAMGANDMSPDHWPPGPDSATGVGLWWAGWTIGPLLGDMTAQKIEQLPVVKLSDIPHPATTVLLTEFIAPDNNLGGLRQASVSGPSQQRQSFQDGGVNFHHGKFNYLMVDGHVELLSWLQTGSWDGNGGIWTMKKGN